MKSIRLRALITLVGVLFAVGAMAPSNARAAGYQNGLFYSVSEGAATITGDNDTITGCPWPCSDFVLVIPSTIGGYPVKSIGPRAFMGNPRFKSVTIPSSVTSIGEYAFTNSYVRTVNIGSSVTSIGASAFANCQNLTSVTIPDSVTTIGDYAFSSHTLASLTIGTSVTTIGAYAFAASAFNAPALTSVTIPDSVTTIGAYAFHNNRLTSLTIGASVTTIGDYAFRFNTLTSLTIPDSVTTIGAYAFSKNTLSSVTIGNSVTSIGSSAFYDNALTSLILGNSVTTIGYRAFGINRLSSVMFPDTVTTIDEGAFAGNRLTSVTIGNSVTSIGRQAFSSNGMTSLIFSNSVTTIGGSAFSDNSLTNVTIGTSVTTIGAFAFGNNSLTSVTIPNSVTSIGDNAFLYNSLTSVTIPNSVTSIGQSAFGYNWLSSVTIPSSVQYIGGFAFENNLSLTNVVFAGDAPQDGGRVFDKNTSLSAVLRYPSARGWGSTWSGKTVVIIRQSFSEPFVARANGSAAGATVTYAGPSTAVALDTIGQAGDGVISFSESDPDCSITGNTMTILQAGDGSCIVTATIGESTTHYGASDTVTVTISKVAASLTFTQPSNVSYGGAPFNLVATTSNTDSATVTFTVAAASQSVCSVRGRTVTVKATGRCTITASRAATANYLAATSVVQSFTVMKAATATTRPTISGTARVGNKLTASKGTWTGYPTPTFTYQWYTCTAAIGSPRTSIPRTCTPISSATGSTFTVQSAQRGKYIAVLVTGTSAGTRSTSWLSKTITKVP